MLKGLLILIKERFNPLSYVPMILVFTMANAMLVSRSDEFSIFSTNFSITFILLFSFFLRLRLFDEIKDFSVDLKINPTRPLARGVLSVQQVKYILFILIVFEISTVSLLSPQNISIYLIAILYSLLMYREFFIGNILRPHLTTYAVSHTAVSSLLGLNAALLSTGVSIGELQENHIYFFLMNWCFFNLFEFARKTYAPTEERLGVDTYSSLFGSLGAVGLSLSQVALGLVLLQFSNPNQNFSVPFLLAGLYFFSSIPFVLNPTPKTAGLFRNTTGIYLLVHYIAVTYSMSRM